MKITPPFIKIGQGIKMFGKAFTLQTIQGFRDSVPVRKSHALLLGYAKISSKTSWFGSGVQGKSSR